jgi:hypothetical protein
MVQVRVVLLLGVIMGVCCYTTYASPPYINGTNDNLLIPPSDIYGTMNTTILNIHSSTCSWDSIHTSLLIVWGGVLVFVSVCVIWSCPANLSDNTDIRPANLSDNTAIRKRVLIEIIILEAFLLGFGLTFSGVLHNSILCSSYNPERVNLYIVVGSVLTLCFISLGVLAIVICCNKNGKTKNGVPDMVGTQVHNDPNADQQGLNTNPR